jgi:hypothetical protein
MTIYCPILDQGEFSTLSFFEASKADSLAIIDFGLEEGDKEEDWNKGIQVRPELPGS